MWRKWAKKGSKPAKKKSPVAKSMQKAEKKAVSVQAKKADAKASASAAALTVTKAGQYISVTKDAFGNTVPSDKVKSVLIHGVANT